MKRAVLMLAIVFGVTSRMALCENAVPKAKNVILLIAEQNIDGPKTGWWASEVDLSITEASLAKKLIASGMDVLDPSQLNKVIQEKKAFRAIDLADSKSVELGTSVQADYVILGKAVASGGGAVPHSTMRSCFANITLKVIRVKDSKIIAYLDETGSSAHLDVITGGKEALANAGQAIAIKVIGAINKDTQDVASCGVSENKVLKEGIK